MEAKKEVVRFSSQELSRQKVGQEQSLKTNKITKSATGKVKKTGGKYETKVVGGVTYMTLK